MARIPRIPSRKDIENLDLRKRPAPMGRKEELHERMARELTNLKRDRRFWEGDKAYQRYVQRQFERVYNDPSGKPQPLRIGPPKIFATDIEPFGVEVGKGNANTGTKSNVSPSRRLNVSRSSNPEATASDSGTSLFHNDVEAPQSLLGQPKPQFEAKHSIDQKKRHVRRTASSSDEPGLVQKYIDFEEIKGAGEGSDLDKARVRLPMLRDLFRRYDWDVAERLLSHYADGSGEPVTIPSEFLRDYPTVIQAQKVVLRYFGEWMIGLREDSRTGIPKLPLGDGETVTLGVPIDIVGGDLDDLVMWESSFKGVGDAGRPFDLWAVGTEAHASIGGGTLQGFAVSLRLDREGDRIAISGQLQFRVRDRYDFAQSDTFGLHALEDNGSARSFWVTSEPWSVDVDGIIVIDEDQPVGAILRLSESPLIRGVAGDYKINPRNPRRSQ